MTSNGQPHRGQPGPRYGIPAMRVIIDDSCGQQVDCPHIILAGLSVTELVDEVEVSMTQVVAPNVVIVDITPKAATQPDTDYLVYLMANGNVQEPQNVRFSARDVQERSRRRLRWRVSTRPPQTYIVNVVRGIEA